MKSIILRHVHCDEQGETSLYTEWMVDGTTIFERQKVVDLLKSTIDKRRYKINERTVDPSTPGYYIVALAKEHGLEIGGSCKDYDLDSRKAWSDRNGERLEINHPSLLAVFEDNPGHHWAPALTSGIAKLCNRVNWDTPADQQVIGDVVLDRGATSAEQEAA